MQNANNNSREILNRYPALVSRGFVNNRTTLARWVAQGLFPKPIAIGPNSRAWRESDLQRWLDERAAASQPNEPEAA